MNKFYNSMRTPGSAITHGIALIMILLGGIPLLLRGYSTSLLSFSTLLIFVISMILLYAASTTYHWLDIGDEGNKMLKKIDHICISLLIAGSYTPICALALPSPKGLIILCIIWTLGLISIFIKVFWIFCPKWLSSIIYIAMGWVCIFVIPDLYILLDPNAFLWLLLGGISYTIGGIIYGLKLPMFDKIHPDFGSHEIFHIFIMIGSLYHFMVMWNIAIYSI